MRPGGEQYFFEAKVDPNSLKVPSNGRMTSGGAWQRQPTMPCKIEETCPKVPE